MNYCREKAGVDFDPKIVNVFLATVNVCSRVIPFRIRYGPSVWTHFQVRYLSRLVKVSPVLADGARECCEEHPKRSGGNRPSHRIDRMAYECSTNPGFKFRPSVADIGGVGPHQGALRRPSPSKIPAKMSRNGQSRYTGGRVPGPCSGFSILRALNRILKNFTYRATN